MGDNPLSKARGLSPHADKIITYLFMYSSFIWTGVPVTAVAKFCSVIYVSVFFFRVMDGWCFAVVALPRPIHLYI